MSTTEQKPTAAMTVAELREELDAAGVVAPAGLKKDLLVMLVDSARSAEPTEKPATEEEPPEVEAEPVEEAEPAESEPPAEEIVAEAEEVEDEPVEAEQVAAAESKALALREEAVVQAPALLPTTAEFQAMREMAAAVASTQMVPTAYRGKPDDVLAAILTGREMGLGPMQSLREIYVLDGKPSLAANLLLARMKQGGLIIIDSESTPTKARIHARRRDTGETAEVEWTIEEAQTATTREKGQTIPLAQKTNWRNYPTDMLWARCVGRLARQFGPDLIGGIMPYSSEEVQDWDDEEADDKAQRYGSDTKTGTWIVPVDEGGRPSWTVFGQRLVERIGAKNVPEWTGQLAELYGFPTLGEVLHSTEVSDERKQDLWRRMCVVLQTLEDEGEVELAPNPRQVVQKAFAKGFDGIQLKGPDWPLDGKEAEKAQAETAESSAQESDSPQAEEPVEAETAPEAEEAVAAEETAETGADDDLPDH